MLDVFVIFDFFPYHPLGVSTLVSRYSSYKLPWSALLYPQQWTSTSPSSCGPASGPDNPKPGTKDEHFLTFDTVSLNLICPSVAASHIFQSYSLTSELKACVISSQLSLKIKVQIFEVIVNYETHPIVTSSKTESLLFPGMARFQHLCCETSSR